MLPLWIRLWLKRWSEIVMDVRSDLTMATSQYPLVRSPEIIPGILCP